MTNLQCKGAIVEMIRYLKRIEGDYRDGNVEYLSFSARDVLFRLGITGRDADKVIAFMAEDGFSYCVDYTIPVVDESGKTECPEQWACIWGFDQLLSRLTCLHSINWLHVGKAV